MNPNKRTFSLIEVIIALMVVSVAIVPFIKGPQNQLFEAQGAILNFQKNLALDCALVDGIASLVQSGLDLEKLPEAPTFTPTITIGNKTFKTTIEITLLEKDEGIPPQAALIGLHITLDDTTHPDLDFPLCITKKK